MATSSLARRKAFLPCLEPDRGTGSGRSTVFMHAWRFEGLNPFLSATFLIQNDINDIEGGDLFLCDTLCDAMQIHWAAD